MDQTIRTPFERPVALADPYGEAEPIQVTLFIDSQGILISLRDAGDVVASVLVEQRRGALYAVVWDERDEGNDPTEEIELVRKQG
jgi:hypothetical protein